MKLNNENQLDAVFYNAASKHFIAMIARPDYMAVLKFNAYARYLKMVFEDCFKCKIILRWE